MHLFPYRSFTIETPLTPDKVVSRLRAGVDPPGSFRGRGDDAPFAGSVTKDAFSIERTIRYRNSFLPRLIGRVEAAPSGGARVTGHMRLDRMVAAFAICWLCITIFASVAAVIKAYLNGRFELGTLFPFAMLLFGAALAWGAFIPESRRGLRELADLLDASRSSLH